MTYADFQVLPEYTSKHTGSALAYKIVNEADPTDVILGATTGMNAREEYETVVIEECGEEGPNEIAQGRYAVTMSIPGFWTPATNDKLPTRSTFIGKTYTVFEIEGINRPGMGTVLNVITGAVLSTYGQQVGARGVKALDLAFSALERFNGEQWAAKTGT